MTGLLGATLLLSPIFEVSLGAFGLTTKDAPTMVIHDTAAGVKRALGEPLTKASAWRFVRGFLASQGAHDEL